LFVVKCFFAALMLTSSPTLFSMGWTREWFNTTFPMSALAALLILRDKFVPSDTVRVFVAITLAWATVWILGVVAIGWFAALTGAFFRETPPEPRYLLPKIKSKAVNFSFGGLWFAAVLVVVALLVRALWHTWH
jgi:hypothetical protein